MDYAYELSFSLAIAMQTLFSGDWRKRLTNGTSMEPTT
jgi:hypothetical protein